MFLRMVYDERLAQAAYVIGCQRSGEAIVVDPERDVDRYIDLAAAHGLSVVAVAETHIHADFVSGSRELAERVGAMVYVSDEGDADWKYGWLDKKVGGGSYAHRLLKDGDVFRVGQIEFRAMHTPGHTPEHLCFLVTDVGGGASEPMGLLTGDFVFVGDLGRPDLLESAAGHVGAMEPSARRLFGSVGLLGGMPEFVQVWPGHGAGSACGKALGAVPMSTIGYEKRFNAAIRAAGSGERGFVDFILSGQPEPPLYFARMKRVNKEGPAVLGGVPAPERVSVSALLGLDARGVAIVDTRAWESFRDGHVPGSLSFPIGSASFSTDAGSMVRADEDVYLVCEAGEVEEAVRALIRVGLDRIVGWCPSGEVERAERGSLARIDEVGCAEGLEMVESGAARVLDVRRGSEFGEGHLPGAINIAHTRLASRLEEVPRDGRVLVNCRSGARSARASALLKRAGFDVVNLRGGYLACQEAEAAEASARGAGAGP
ncbi:MAG: MBL fold metallo-hydrolase [Phycisphaerales bacterium]